VFLVILLHKPFDSLTLGTLMAAGGWSVRWRHVINGLFALAVPLGAVLFHVGIRGQVDSDERLVGCALAFASGTFLCIASSDLLPELQFHRHDRAKLSAALLIGIVLAGTVAHFEAVHHNHDHRDAPPMHEQEDSNYDTARP
jgi:zinc and cadmium transporter